MYYEKIKTKREEGTMTKLGELVAMAAKWLMALSDEMVYKIEEREVKLP